MSDSMLRKTVLVTGATSGIGLEAAVVLAGAGAEVVMIGEGHNQQGRNPVRFSKQEFQGTAPAVTSYPLS